MVKDKKRTQKILKLRSCIITRGSTPDIENLLQSMLFQLGRKTCYLSNLTYFHLARDLHTRPYLYVCTDICLKTIQGQLPLYLDLIYSHIWNIKSLTLTILVLVSYADNCCKSHIDGIKFSSRGEESQMFQI